MRNEEKKKLLTNTIFNIFMIFNPYRIYFYIIEIIHSMILAFKVHLNALRLYIKGLPYLLIPLLLLVNFQLYEPALTNFLSTHFQKNVSGVILNLFYYFILWPYLVSPIYLSIYHAKIGTKPTLTNLFKSSHQNFFKIFLLRLLVVSLTAIVLMTILGLYFYMMPKEGGAIHYSYKSTEPTYHLSSNYLVGNILLFISLYTLLYLLLRLFFAEWLIVLKGYSPFQAIKESWQLLSEQVSVVFFSVIIICGVAILLPHVLHLVFPQYSEKITFFSIKAFGAYYFAVVISLQELRDIKETR